MSNKNLKIGMGQLLVEGGEPERNLKRAFELVKEAKGEKCDIVLLPECLDLAWTHPSSKSEAQTIPGSLSDQMCQYADDQSIFICAGLTEQRQDKVYNSAILIDDTGQIILKYRKINVLEVGQDFYEIGDSLSVVDTPFGVIGVNICSDNYMDGACIGHTLARMGAQVILSPSSWTVDYSITEEEDPYGEKWIKPYSTLASLYNLVIVGTTSVGIIVGGPYEGKKMVGCSLAMGASGIIARGHYNEFASQLIVAEFEVPVRKEKGTAIGEVLKGHGDTFQKQN